MLSRGNAAYHIFSPQLFWKDKCWNGRQFFCQRQRWEQPASLFRKSPSSVIATRGGEVWDERSLSLPFVWREVRFHLMCISFSSVFKRLRLGWMNSSSESSVSSSFSFVLGASSISATSGNSSPGKICRSFSSKYTPTACPNTAISEPACGRRGGGGMWRWQEAGGMDGLKQEEKEIEIN